MASTISVNFATPEEVYIETPPSKKSISAKTLSDVLGGGVVGGGYIQLTGTLPNKPMTGFLQLTSLMPRNEWHAAPKKYVDDHAYTRRYYYEIDDVKASSNLPGYFSSNTTIISGLDKNTSPLYFFEKSDGYYQNSWRYLDVYRNGILQAFPADYDLINVTTFYGGATAIKFNTPLQKGANIQVNVGNVGAYPVTFGVNRVLSGFATEMSSASGEVVISVIPEDLASTDNQTRNREVSNRFISPVSLLRSPYAVKAKGVFRKEGGHFPDLANQNRYGNAEGVFENITTTNLLSVVSDPDRTLPSTPTKLRCYITPNVVDTIDYNVYLTFNTEDSSSVDDVVNGTVISNSRSLTSFDFFVYDSFYSTPLNIHEINIIII
jgi:hypothetical protein